MNERQRAISEAIGLLLRKADEWDLKDDCEALTYRRAATELADLLLVADVKEVASTADEGCTPPAPTLESVAELLDRIRQQLALFAGDVSVCIESTPDSTQIHTGFKGRRRLYRSSLGEGWGSR